MRAKKKKIEKEVANVFKRQKILEKKSMSMGSDRGIMKPHSLLEL
ncbi:hypothetical protein ACYSNO_06820 [Enterococcus sp. LJL98]